MRPAAASAVARGSRAARTAGRSTTRRSAPSSAVRRAAASGSTTKQTTPSRFTSASGQWTRAFGAVSALVGGEGRRTQIRSIEELRYSVTNVESGPFYGGGTRNQRRRLRPRQRRAGGAADHRARCPRRLLELDSVRHGAARRTRPNFFSPRASASWQVSDAVSVHGAGYRSHRTPTLNELYRGFRVGLIDTLPNPLLDPETLTGGEGGVMFTHAPVLGARHGLRQSARERHHQRDDRHESPRTPEHRHDQRAGIEVEATYRLHSRWTLNGAHRRDALALRRHARAAGPRRQSRAAGAEVPGRRFGDLLGSDRVHRLGAGARVRPAVRRRSQSSSSSSSTASSTSPPASRCCAG